MGGHYPPRRTPLPALGVPALVPHGEAPAMATRIGVDVGGTNTDAVVVVDGAVVDAHKTPTTADVTDGIVSAIGAVLASHAGPVADVDAVMIGTTHFTNAVLERRGLLPVGVIRLALPSTAAIPPLTDWPEDLSNLVGGHTYLVRGGYQYTGDLADALDEKGLLDAARDMKSHGVRSVAVTGLFSPVNGSMEARAAEIARNELPDAHLTLSSTIGRIGLLERENAAILNASLADLSRQVVESFRAALASLGIDAPLFISQNDGTLMSDAFVARYPVLTFASGPTNSMRGAGFLSGLDDGLVVDIGGTTTDIGVLSRGFPRESFLESDIGGVRTNFRMPDLLVRALGGGSLVRESNGEIEVGPRSLGFRMATEGMVFGGRTLTATDLAVAAGHADIGDRALVRHVSERVVRHGMARIHAIVEEGVDRMKTSAQPLPLVLVGGGAALIDRDIAGASEIVVPKHAGVANAVGATIAKISGETDRVFSYEKMDRDTAIETATEEAKARAAAAGALPGSIEVLEVEELPVAYVPGGSVRVRVKVAGDLGAVATAAVS